ncbi:hypothetical protein EB796_008451 [Bugula neritina]|uniref:Uncharacterized protein n=1 Tax=Bugula neritina TaxID=10212 RepID=A0A7J7K3N9_BUGNE|nr:hypothetical protein EB796_008451 [Bugula neritina]
MEGAVLTSEEQILLILGRANQVKYPSLMENVEQFRTLAIETEDISELVENLLVFTEEAQKMVVLARLMNTLESIATKTKTSTTTYANRYINKAKTALYTTLCF